MNELKTQINKELIRKQVLDASITKIYKAGNTGLITFDINDREYWAKLTPTGKLKKNSIRRNNF